MFLPKGDLTTLATSGFEVRKGEAIIQGNDLGLSCQILKAFLKQNLSVQKRTAIEVKLVCLYLCWYRGIQAKVGNPLRHALSVNTSEP